MKAFFAMIVLITTAACAQDPVPPKVPEAKLAWDAPTVDEGLKGYRIYYGTETRDYDKVVEVPADKFEGVVLNLMQKTKYFFAVTAWNDYGESDFSNEVSYTTPGKPGAPIRLRLAMNGETKKIALVLDGEPGEKVKIAASFDLKNWEDLAEVEIPAEGTGEWIDEDSNVNQRRFYKAALAVAK